MEIKLLIVAKCIVNVFAKHFIEEFKKVINSSKVYCKCKFSIYACDYIGLLIVAKCIVNEKLLQHFQNLHSLLIVAKCIVNSCMLTTYVP